jgi:hypothetical protein
MAVARVLRQFAALCRFTQAENPQCMWLQQEGKNF